MSKLSGPLKALIDASHARPHTIPAPPQITSIYSRIASVASSHSLTTPTWLTLSTAATMTMNSPQSLLHLHTLAFSQPHSNPVETAELIREVGLKCISFNGIPRVINCLGAFHSGLPSDVQAKLSTRPTRQLDASNANTITKRGRDLWNAIYTPFEDKLVAKLAQSHPNLPVHIINAHYGTLLSNPVPNMPVDVGRVLTSIIAIACLRAQGGVGPQVVSHVFGLRKAFEDEGSRKGAEEEVGKEGGEWLVSEEGNRWVLEAVDSIVGAIGGKQGSNFASGPEELKAKL